MNTSHPKLKVCHVITGLGDGGAEAVLFRLCTHSSRVENVVISLMGDGKYGKLLRERGISVYCLDLPKGKIRLGSIIQLYILFRNIKPDLVQTWMYHADLIGGVVAKLSGIRAVVWGVHNTLLKKERQFFATRIVATICSYLSSWVPARIVYCANRSAEFHQLLGYSKEKTIVIPNGYDLVLFNKNTDARHRFRNELAVHSGAFLLGMVARVDPQKDHINLFRSLQILKLENLDFRCVLAGSSISWNNLNLVDQIRSFGIEDRIILVGQRADIPQVMNGLDLHVLSSKSEAFPNVVAEAMACGVPCVATDVGDASKILGETGWVVRPSDPVALSSAIKLAINEWAGKKTEWKIRQEEARNIIKENYSVERMFSSYESVWLETINELNQFTS